MIYKAGGSYYGEFTTQRFDTGNATDADSLPTATATTNGADDGSFTLTCAKIDTGRYKITGTIPVGYSIGDRVQVSVAATVNSVAGKNVVDSFSIDSEFVSDLNDPSAADIKTAMEAGGSSLASILQDTGTTLPAAITALNDPTAADIVTALFAKTGITAGGTASFQDVVKKLLAAATWNFELDGTDLKLYDDDNATLLATIPLQAAGPRG